MARLILCVTHEKAARSASGETAVAYGATDSRGPHVWYITHMRTVHVRCEARAVDAARASRDACSCLRSTGVSGYLYEYEFRISFRSRAARAW